MRTVATGNLAIGLFQHDTNRNQEPNLHFHAVVANVTRGPDGVWRTLKNDRLWSLNTLLNSIAMARFRTSVDKLGYEAGPALKHGNFEARGISREQLMAFSTRRQEVLDARRGSGLEAGRIATLVTRSAKEAIEDRGALTVRWDQAAKKIGLDLKPLVESAHLRAAQQERETARPTTLVERGIARLREFAARISGEERDPLVPSHVLKKGPEAIAAAQAVASGVRHLSQREAGFEREALYKAALDFGLPTTISHVEAAVRSLVRAGHLFEGKGEHRGWVASREAVEVETRILAWAAEGKGAIKPGIAGDEAESRVQASAEINHGFKLNEGQLGAARLILSSADRTIAVQGVAGAGKSSLLKPVAEVLREEGHPVIGLAVQNTLVQMLEGDTGIRSQTLARFLTDWGKLIDEPGSGAHQTEAEAALKDHVLVLDEASMISNADKERLIRIANLANVHRLVLIGDRKQLGAVDAGKPFALLQRGGIAKAEMNTNLRGRDPVLRQAQAAAQAGFVRSALDHLKGHTIEAKGDGAIVAAERWLSLPPSPSRAKLTAALSDGFLVAVDRQIVGCVGLDHLSVKHIVAEFMPDGESTPPIGLATVIDDRPLPGMGLAADERPDAAGNIPLHYLVDPAVRRDVGGIFKGKSLDIDGRAIKPVRTQYRIEHQRDASGLLEGARPGGISHSGFFVPRILAISRSWRRVSGGRPLYER